jgi:hypothetical protein
MSDNEDVFRVLEEEEPMPRPPQLRVYLRSDASLPIHSVSAALPDYDVIVPRSKNEAAYIRRMPTDSQREYKGEVERVAKILALLLIADTYLSCFYDDSAGRTQHVVEMRKATGVPNFVETYTGR